MTPPAIAVGAGSMWSVRLICDLDGTLVDSYSGIKAALQEALAAVGGSAAEPLDRWIVGPPLDELLHRTIGHMDPTTIAKARQVFVEVYDHDACKQAEPFRGVQQMLEHLLAAGARLGLATNKRSIPTNAILDARGWRSMFMDVETVDSPPGYPRKKSDMLREIMRRDAATRSSPYYLGDTAADAVAAQEASVPFILAEWGAVLSTEPTAGFVASSPAAVLQYLTGAARTPPMSLLRNHFRGL